MYALRFDMRAPDGPASAPGLYAAALEMAEWADANGAAAISICEHHASPDGYLPAPLLLAAAVAARTKRIPIRVTAVITPLWEPIRLAEEMAVLDILSGGRISYVLGLGYRQVEYDLFGIAKSDRGGLMDVAVETLRAAFNGAPLPHRDVSLRVTPMPLTPGGPALALAGSTPAAARRAARLGLGMVTETAGLRSAYEQACAERDVTPGLFLEAAPETVTVGFVDPDPDALWERVGAHLLHDARTYAQWNADAGKTGLTGVGARVDTAAELRAAGHPYRVFTPDEAVAYIKSHRVINVAPLCGGAPPEIGWSTLHHIVDDVLPRL